MKFLLDEFQEGEMPFGEMHSPYREVNKRVRSDLRDEQVTSSLFSTTIDNLRSRFIQSLSIFLSTSINNLLNKLYIKPQVISAKKIESSMISNASSCIENQLNLTTTVDLTEKQLTGVENQFGNNVSGMSRPSTADN